MIYNSCMALYEVYRYFFPLNGVGELTDEVGQCKQDLLNP